MGKPQDVVKVVCLLWKLIVPAKDSTMMNLNDHLYVHNPVVYAGLSQVAAHLKFFTLRKSQVLLLKWLNMKRTISDGYSEPCSVNISQRKMHEKCFPLISQIT